LRKVGIEISFERDTSARRTRQIKITRNEVEPDNRAQKPSEPSGWENANKIDSPSLLSDYRPKKTLMKSTPRTVRTVRTVYARSAHRAVDHRRARADDRYLGRGCRVPAKGGGSGTPRAIGPPRRAGQAADRQSLAARQRHL